jgi:hypothetical protein
MTKPKTVNESATNPSSIASTATAISKALTKAKQKAKIDLDAMCQPELLGAAMKAQDGAKASWIVWAETVSKNGVTSELIPANKVTDFKTALGRVIANSLFSTDEIAIYLADKPTAKAWDGAKREIRNALQVRVNGMVHHAKRALLRFEGAIVDKLQGGEGPAKDSEGTSGKPTGARKATTLQERIARDCKAMCDDLKAKEMTAEAKQAFDLLAQVVKLAKAKKPFVVVAK